MAYNWTRPAKSITAIPAMLPQQIDLVLQGELYWRLDDHVQADAGSSNAWSKVAGLMPAKGLSAAEFGGRAVRVGLAGGAGAVA
jgi:DNA ligase (NAD+)